MKKNNENTKKFIENEINELEIIKKNKINNLQDDLHNYAIEKQYESSIKKIKKNESENFYKIYMTQFFRRLGLIKLINSILKIINENKLMIIVFIISIIAASIKPVFFTKYNIFNNILKNNVTIGIMAIGMTFVIISKGIDLSVGSILGFAGMISMGLLLDGTPTILAFLIGILIAITLGFVQGILVSYIKLPPFIVTLVGLLAIRGGVYIYAEGSPKTDVRNKTFDFLNNTNLLGLPIIVILFLSLTFIGMFVLKYLSFGRKVYSVGDNVEAAQLSGINTKKIITICYLISGLTAGIAAFVFSSRISSAGPTSGNAYELEVIAAVVLGGTSLSGGKGGVGKTFLGWLVISILSNALILLGFDSNYQLVFKGLVILLAVILDKNFAFLAKLKKWKNKLF